MNVGKQRTVYLLAVVHCSCTLINKIPFVSRSTSVFVALCKRDLPDECVTNNCGKTKRKSSLKNHLNLFGELNLYCYEIFIIISPNIRRVTNYRNEAVENVEHSRVWTSVIRVKTRNCSGVTLIRRLVDCLAGDCSGDFIIKPSLDPKRDIPI